MAINIHNSGTDAMAIEFHLIWLEQVNAVEAIRSRHGEDAAFDYIVGEKLINFAEAADDRPEFARELPRFVAAIRDTFPPDTMRSGLRRVARDLAEDEVDAANALREKRAKAPGNTSPPEDLESGDDDELDDADTLARRVEQFAARRRRFEFLSELLVADSLGTA